MRNKRFVKHTSRAFAILMSAMMAVGIATPVSAAEKKETKKETQAGKNEVAKASVPTEKKLPKKKIRQRRYM